VIEVLRVLIVAAVLTVAIVGCSRNDDQKLPSVAPVSGHSSNKEAVVVVPDSVKGKWSAVKIAVVNKERNKESVYTVAIGSEVNIADSGLTIKVDNFLPHFMMSGTTLTSQSNEPKNPAAQIRISEGGKEIFKGWLFSLYPTTHAFQHPKYGFALVDFLPAR
jgi:hypothetical protein